MSRSSTTVRFLALAAMGTLAACACEENPEQQEYCNEIAGPEATAVSTEGGSVVAPELAALLEASLGRALAGHAAT